MEHLKHFFKQKGLYLACLAVVFAATAAGVLALRSVLNHVVELTGTAQEETPWQDDTTVNKPDTTQPEPVRTPAPASSASPSSDAASGCPDFSKIQSHASAKFAYPGKVINAAVNSLQAVRHHINKTAGQLMIRLSRIGQGGSCHSYLLQA